MCGTVLFQLLEIDSEQLFILFSLLLRLVLELSYPK